jgi:hypothetical protein
VAFYFQLNGTMKLSQLILIALLLLIISSCGRKEYTEQGILEIKAEIDSLLRKPETYEQFNWGSASAYSNFTAYFHNYRLIFINEDYRHRKGGNSFNLYYYKDGKLLYFIGRELVYTPRKQTKSISMLVDPDEDVVYYEKILGGNRASLEKEETKAIITHAMQLNDIVLRRSLVLSRSDK